MPEQSEFGQALDLIIKQAQAAAWDRGYTSGHSRAMRRMSDEPDVERAKNPYREDPDA